jgi:hypothetical protein
MPRRCFLEYKSQKETRITLILQTQSFLSHLPSSTFLVYIFKKKNNPQAYLKLHIYSEASDNPKSCFPPLNWGSSNYSDTQKIKLKFIQCQNQASHIPSLLFSVFYIILSAPTICAWILSLKRDSWFKRLS